MMALVKVLLTIAAIAAATVDSNDLSVSGANPIRKVVNLLQNMQKEIETEGLKEKELFDKFMCFCTGNNEDLEKEVADGKSQLEELSAALKSDTAEKARLEGELVQHKADLAQAENDLNEAAALRKKESAEFAETDADSKANIKALGGAIPALEKGMGGASLMQLPGGVGDKVRHMAETFANDFERKAVDSFLEESGDYAPQSGQIVGILKNMLDEMTASQKKAEEDETAAATGFGDLKASKESEVAAAKEAIQTKTVRGGELALTISQSTDSIEDTEKTVADNEKFLANLAATCATKEKEWAERSKARQDEIAAVSEAIGILNDDDALDVFKKAMPAALEQERLGLLQTFGSSASRLHRVQAILQQIQQSSSPARSPKLRAMLFSIRSKLRRHGKAGSKGDFGEVLGMVDGMVEVEQDEQKQDDTEKPWCNGEFEKSAREDKAEHQEIAKLDAQMSEQSDAIAALDAEIAGLVKENQDLDKSVAEATEQRKEEHAEYLDSTQLTQTAIGLIEKAKQRMVKFYNPTLYKAPPKKELTMEEKILEAGSFLQLRRGLLGRAVKAARKQPEAPPTWEGGEVKKSEKSSGVLALMDTIVKDLGTEMKDAEYEEKTSQKDYAELMGDSQATRQANVESITEKMTAKAGIGSKKQDARQKEMHDFEDLQNIATYTGDLHMKCDLLLEQYDVKKEARVKEVEGLKNAKAILSGASFGR